MLKQKIKGLDAQRLDTLAVLVGDAIELILGDRLHVDGHRTAPFASSAGDDDRRISIHGALPADT